MSQDFFHGKTMNNGKTGKTTMKTFYFDIQVIKTVFIYEIRPETFYDEVINFFSVNIFKISPMCLSKISQVANFANIRI